MSLRELVSHENVACRYSATSKKQLLQHLADLASDLCDIPSRVILDSIIKREKLGNTGIGGGAAIPHALVEGVSNDIVLIATLDQPLAFDASDRRDVDVVCMVIGPHGANARHLTTVALASRMLKDRCDAMRAATSTEDLLQAIEFSAENSVAA